MLPQQQQLLNSSIASLTQWLKGISLVVTCFWESLTLLGHLFQYVCQLSFLSLLPTHAGPRTNRFAQSRNGNYRYWVLQL